MFKKWKAIVNRPLKFIDVLTTLIPLGITIFLCVYRKNIPELVPLHWNFAGEIDDFADPVSYIMLLIMMYFFYAWHTISKILPSFDLKDNLFGKEHAHKVTEEIEHKYINILLGMLWCCDLIVQAIFAYIIICGVFVRNLDIWFLPTAFLLLTADFIWFIVRIMKLKKLVSL